MTTLLMLITALLTPLLTLLLVALLDIQRRGCWSGFTWLEALHVYALKMAAYVKTHWIQRQFERDTEHFPECQSELLLRILRRHEDSAYGRDHQLSSINSVGGFRASQPVTEYPHYRSYIDRVAAGEKTAMLSADAEVILLAETSGTTGPNKRFPLSRGAARVMARHLRCGADHVAQWRDVAAWNLRLRMVVTLHQPAKHTEGGHLQGAIGLLMGSTFSKASCFCTPAAGYRITDEAASHYVHALFGLREVSLNSINTVFLSSLVTLLKRMEAHQEDLVADLRHGRLKDSLDITDDIRAELNAQLTPLPSRAEQVRAAFAAGSAGLVPRLWPDISFVGGSHAGVANTAYPALVRHYCGSMVPVLDCVFGCSEVGLLATVTSYRGDSGRVFTLIPDAAFFEFLPVVEDRVQDLEEIRPDDVLLSHQLKVGDEYELLVTTRGGLYRYRVGDVFRVVGFYNRAPRVQFLYRAGQLLNICSEKVSEAAFHQALELARHGWPANTTLREYTTAVSPLLGQEEEEVPHYLLFLELDGGPPLSQEDTRLVEESLQQHHERYRLLRQLGRLGPVTVHQLLPGTFGRFTQQLKSLKPAASAGSAPSNLSQFKMPRVMRSRERVLWLLENVR